MAQSDSSVRNYVIRVQVLEIYASFVKLAKLTEDLVYSMGYLELRESTL